MREPFWPLLLVFGLVARHGQAQDSQGGGARLSFVRAESAADCIAAPALEQEIIRRMGRDPFSGPPRQWIEALVDGAGGYYTVQLFERDQAGKTLGTRQLRAAAADCHQLDDAMVLAIALIIDPSAKFPSSSAVVQTPPALATPPSTQSPANETVQPAAPSAAAQGGAKPIRPTVAAASGPFIQRERRAGLGASATAAALMVHGVLPGLAPGVELVTQLSVEPRARYALRFSALYLPEVRQSTALGALGYGLTAFEAGACAASPDRRVRWFACSALGLGAVHSVVYDPLPFAPGDRLWLALRLEVGLELRLAGPLGAELRAFDLIAAQRRDFRVRSGQGAETAFSQASLMPGLAFGLGLAF